MDLDPELEMIMWKRMEQPDLHIWTRYRDPCKRVPLPLLWGINIDMKGMLAKMLLGEVAR
jgi:hypothetical protein